MRTALIAVVCSARTAPAAAHADIYAASEGQPPGRSDLDISLVDMSTGTAVALPAGVNTPEASELHPSISADGTRMVFERRAGPTIRIVLVDLRTGASADLFNGFEQAANPQTTPGISADGKTVATGEAFSADFAPQLTMTDVSAFPAGPFPHSTFKASFHFPTGITGVTANPVLSDNQVAFDETPAGGHTHVVLAFPGGPSSFPFGDSNSNSTHPALGRPGGVRTILFDQFKGPQRDIAFRTYDSPIDVISRPTVSLDQVNSSAFDDSRPSFSADGRYVAFVSRQPNAAVRLEVWDSATQTFVGGFGLGNADAVTDGATSVFLRPVLTLSGIVGSQVNFQLLQNAGIGILVQRVVGHHQQFGQTVPTLKMVGRVPLGRFDAGRGHVRWDGRVGGRRLPRGRYQVTVRAVDSAAARARPRDAARRPSGNGERIAAALSRGPRFARRAFGPVLTDSLLTAPAAIRFGPMRTWLRQVRPH